MNVISEVIKIAGSQQELAKKLSDKGLGITQPAIVGWLKKGRVTSKYAVAVEQITGIDRRKLCPNFNWGEKS